MPDSSSKSAAARRMVEALLETPKLAIDKLPVLHQIFERVATSCTESMRNICSVPTTFFVNQVKPDQAWDILENYEDAIAAMFYVPEWDAPVLIGVDRKFVFSVIEAAYGSDQTEQPTSSDRPFSNFEAEFIKEILNIAATALESCFETITQVDIQLRPARNQRRIHNPGPERHPGRRRADPVPGHGQWRAHVHPDPAGGALSDPQKTSS